jgi:glycosyltransferase involved in cell wall biosynthesis
LRSIAQQTRVPDEVLIFDDRSTDATVDIVHSVCTEAGLKYSLCINERRLGVEGNFAYGMSQARGDVLFFADCDDIWVPEKVVKMTAPFEHDPDVTLVYSDAYITGPDLTRTEYRLFTWKPQKKRLQEGDARPIGEFLRKGQSPGIKASAMAFSSKVRDLAGPLPEGIAHDNWVSFFGYALGKVVVIDEPLHLYRRHDQAWGSSSSNRLISGLKAPVDQSSQPRRDKAHLAQCLYARMCDMDREMQGKITFPPRFYDLKLAAQEAARTLAARKAIKKTPKGGQRVLQGLLALARGDYTAMKGYRQKLKRLYQDMRS